MADFTYALHDDGVAGVTLVRTGGAVGMGYAIQVRGAKSITFDRRPVVFVDGVRVDGLGFGDGLEALELVSSGTIARIEVVKGAAGLRRLSFLSTLETFRRPPAASANLPTAVSAPP